MARPHRSRRATLNKTGAVMTAQRERLPNRRFSETFDVELGGRKYRCSYSRFPDGRLAEVFISNNRVNSDRTPPRKTVRSFAASLQFGVPLETIRRALMRDAQGRASGPLGIALDLLAERDQ